MAENGQARGMTLLDGALNELDDELQRLDGAVCRANAMLQPVMRPTVPAPTGGSLAKDPEPEEVSAVVSRLRHMSRVAFNIRRELEETLDRVEV